MRKLIFLVLLVGLLVILYRATRNDKNSVIQQAVSDIKNVVNNSTLLSEKSSSLMSSDDTQVQSPQGGEAPNADVTVGLQNLNPEQLKKWVESESISMNSTQNDTQEIQMRLVAQAQTLKPEQLVALKQMALNSDFAVNARIFSAYMLSLNTAQESQEQLFEVAKARLPDVGAVLPHSEAELKHTQELAIRFMQIDELFQRAKTDANARDKLKLLSLEAESDRVRNYAQKKLQELK